MKVRNVTRGETYEFNSYVHLLFLARAYGWRLLWRTRHRQPWESMR